MRIKHINTLTMPAVIALLAVFVLDLSLLSLGASGQFPPPFRFDGFPPPEPTRSSSSPSSPAGDSLDSNPPTSPLASINSSNSDASQPLIWQPLRATFRPLNRPVSPAPPTAPAPPVPLALSLGTEPISSSPSSSDSPPGISDGNARFAAPSSSSSSSSFGSEFLSTTGLASDLAAVPNGSPTPAPASSSNGDSLDNEDLPTRVPLSRFRPTKAPSSDPQTQSTPTPVSLPTVSAATFPLATAASRSHNLTASNLASTRPSARTNTSNANHHITSECLECICEASTNCNPNSRCQTSDVRHTRCGMFLISYDQWLETGLSKELVSAEALQQDAAADERTFYECVTNRDCAERLLTIYAHRHSKDCDKDGRIDCYDMAAVHQGGLDGCQSESMLDSQYWSDFNACFGFGR